MADPLPPEIEGLSIGIGGERVLTPSQACSAIPIIGSLDGTYYKRTHLHRAFSATAVNGQLYVAAPTHSTTVNPQPGTNLQYELYVVFLYSPEAALTPTVTLKAYDGTDYTTVWEEKIAVGSTVLRFPLSAPLAFGESQTVHISSPDTAAAGITIEAFGAVRPVN